MGLHQGAVGGLGALLANCPLASAQEGRALSFLKGD